MIKRLWSKIKTPKENGNKNTKDEDCHFQFKNEDDYVLDAAPDYFFANEPSERSSQENNQLKNVHNEETSSKNEQSACDKDEEINKDADLAEEEEKEKKQEGKPTDRKNFRKPKGSPTQNVFNIEGGNVHIGNIITRTYNIEQNYNVGLPKKGAAMKKHKLTPQIEEVFQSSAKLGSDHMQYLSKHFGKSWRKIGSVLEISEGLMDKMELDLEKDVVEMSFEVMKTWRRREGGNATVGNLCQQLWKSQIPRAREAVKLFADDFGKFNECDSD